MRYLNKGLILVNRRLSKIALTNKEEKISRSRCGYHFIAAAKPKENALGIDALGPYKFYNFYIIFTIEYTVIQIQCI
jgi:hypothetical protein